MVLIQMCVKGKREKREWSMFSVHVEVEFRGGGECQRPRDKEQGAQTSDVVP